MANSPPLRVAKTVSHGRPALLGHGEEKEKQRFTRSGNLYVALYAWYA